MKLVIPVYKTEFYIISYELFQHLRTNKLGTAINDVAALKPELKNKRGEQCQKAI